MHPLGRKSSPAHSMYFFVCFKSAYDETDRLKDFHSWVAHVGKKTMGSES